jgi:hypothetical protein
MFQSAQGVIEEGYSREKDPQVPRLAEATVPPIVKAGPPPDPRVVEAVDSLLATTTMHYTSGTKCYYAHCTSLYGTHQEVRDVKTLSSLFTVFNPNCAECADLYAAHGMDGFAELVSRFDVFAFRALPDGSIPAGVAKELEAAKENGLLIFELPSNVSRRVLSVALTREYLKEVGAR